MNGNWVFFFGVGGVLGGSGGSWWMVVCAVMGANLAPVEVLVGGGKGGFGLEKRFMSFNVDFY